MPIQHFEQNPTAILSDEEILKLAPGAFATTHESKSKRYQHINTGEVIRALSEVGFYSTGATDIVRPTRRNSLIPREHKRHIIRLSHVDQIGKNSEYRNDVIISTSHDSRQAFKANLGILRFVCSNGMVAFDESPFSEGFSVKFHHNASASINNVVEAVSKLAQRSSELDGIIREMSMIKLTPEEISDFSRRATLLRLGLKEDASPEILSKYDFDAMVRRRNEDVGNDLWSVLNVAQENGTKGGIRVRTQGARLQNIRPIRGATRDYNFNREIFALADKYRRSHVSPAIVAV